MLMLMLQHPHSHISFLCLCLSHKWGLGFRLQIKRNTQKQDLAQRHIKFWDRIKVSIRPTTSIPSATSKLYYKQQRNLMRGTQGWSVIINLLHHFVNN